MPRKRIKFKGKKVINFNNLTEELYEAICSKNSMEELITRKQMFDKNNPDLCKQIWSLHKEEVTSRRKLDKNNAGKRPCLWWVCERPEDIKILRYDKYTNINGKPEPVEMWPDGHIETEYPIYEGETAYLERLGLLEDWELEVFNSGKLYYKDMENRMLPY